MNSWPMQGELMYSNSLEYCAKSKRIRGRSHGIAVLLHMSIIILQPITGHIKHIASRLKNGQIF